MKQNKRKTCIRLCGGIGNQLFQYSFGCLRRSIGDEVLYDVKNGFCHDPFQRQFSLENLNLRVQHAKSTDIPFGLNWKAPYSQLAKFAWKSIPVRYRQVYYEKKPFAFDAFAADRSNCSKYFWGYWQNNKYVGSIKKTLNLSLFTKKKSAPFKIILNKFSNSPTLAVHVRRYKDKDKNGNVIKNVVKNHGVCEASYFYEALSYIPKNTYSSIFIFSDHSQWVKENIKFSGSVFFVKDVFSFSDTEELALMASCTHFIISNSSFGWWGAHLGSAKNKIVIAPKKWNRAYNSNSEDLCPKEWKTI